MIKRADDSESLVDHSLQKIDLYFRVSAPLGKVKITAKCGDTVLATAVRPRVAPGEMEKITVKAADLENVTGPVTVQLEVL